MCVCVCRQFDGLVDCIRKIYKSDGLGGLYQVCVYVCVWMYLFVSVHGLGGLYQICVYVCVWMYLFVSVHV